MNLFTFEHHRTLVWSASILCVVLMMTYFILCLLKNQNDSVSYTKHVAGRLACISYASVAPIMLWCAIIESIHFFVTPIEDYLAWLRLVHTGIMFLLGFIYLEHGRVYILNLREIQNNGNNWRKGITAHIRPDQFDTLILSQDAEKLPQ